MSGEVSTGNTVKSAQGWLALSPVALFLALYLGVSVALGDFYKMPIAVALLGASLWAIVVYRGHTLLERIEVFSREAGNANVLYMIWIFILAGAFATVADKTGAVSATVALTLDSLPQSFIVPGLFAAACFISMAIGTSVGTVVALTPLAVNFAQNVGADVPFFVAVVLGGAFFGDNLSFISDTTIAATRTQGCRMNEKFKANIAIVFPAAVITLAIYLAGDYSFSTPHDLPDVNPWLVIPYLLVIVLAIAGVNVALTLVTGLAAAVILGLAEGYDIMTLMEFMGTGVDSMGNLIIITLLATGMVGVIKAAGGLAFLLRMLARKVTGYRGAQAVIVTLVAIVNVCTANNTVAILTVGEISRDIARRYKVQPRRAASLLDTGSCVVQCLIPYGAQTLFATTMAGISPTAPWPYLYYPWVLLVVLSISLMLRRKTAAKPEQ